MINGKIQHGDTIDAGFHRQIYSGPSDCLSRILSRRLCPSVRADVSDRIRFRVGEFREIVERSTRVNLRDAMYMEDRQGKRR